MPDRTVEQKARLAAAITQDVPSILQVGEEFVSGGIAGVRPPDWTETVHKPGIPTQPQNRYKQPGYNP